ncbi:MAG: motility protein A [Angelakisella sp.]|nr:motility protein A [Angelakisella sp.]
MSIFGWISGSVLIFIGIVLNKITTDGVTTYDWVFSNAVNFFDPTSIAIVIGGTLAALMISFPGKFFAKIPKHLKIIFVPTKYNPRAFIDQLVEFAKEARINGLLALEDKLSDTEDTFFKNSLMLVVDSVDPEKIKSLLETELEYLDDRHAQDRAFYDKAAGYAPAFGMIGTLIGLVNLLKDLQDPNNIGPSMAVALITTFYGTILANFVFSPISNKLRIRHEEEYLCKMIISEGVQSIQAGDNPRFIEEKLIQLLPSSMAKQSSDSESRSGRKDKKQKPIKVKR